MTRNSKIPGTLEGPVVSFGAFSTTNRNFGHVYNSNRALQHLYVDYNRNLHRCATSTFFRAEKLKTASSSRTRRFRTNAPLLLQLLASPPWSLLAW